MVVEVSRGYIGDPEIGTLEEVEVYGICDSCGIEMGLNEFAFSFEDGYVCEDCFVEHHKNHTVEDLIDEEKVEMKEV